ncbi:MAG TPA: Gfo/Idh/MocA family oxidoreductase [Verrucomicrobiae bacterium]|nr:Gfo/Idh/MocA family oxidoreductase [Verrucomicrobiae bacterium]
MADKLRCGVIGAGAAGCDHLHSLSTCFRAAAVAIAEINPQNSREACDRYRIARSYTDYHELLEQPDIDAITIALPNHLHTSVAIEALKARKHVLVEKPMSTSLKDAVKIVETARKMKRTVMVGQNLRFDRQTQLAKSLIERGELGEVYHARGFYLRRSGIPRIGSWFTQKRYSGGGCVYDLAGHILDTCLFLFNDFKVSSVFAQTHAHFGSRGLGEMNWGKSEIDPKKPFDVEDHGSALIKLQSGRSITLDVSWAGFHPAEAREHGVDLLGTNGGLSLFPARLFRNGPNGYETVHLGGTKMAYVDDRIHHFVNCVLDGKKPLISVEESLQVQQVLDAIYASAESGKEIRLKY